MLKKIYDDLRALLQSNTYCSMFDNARAFPDPYPFAKSTATTFFGQLGQRRLRLSPAGDVLVALCDDERVLLYDTKSGEMRTVAQFPALGAQVTDAAFSADGKTLHVIALATGGNDSLWASGALSGTNVTWSAPITVCDVELLSIATQSAKPNLFYAVAQNGIYEFAPPSIPNKPTPKFTWAGHVFTGHIAIETVGATVQILATARAGTDASFYDSFFAVPSAGNNLANQPSVPFLKTLDGLGRDGMCVVHGAAFTRLYIGLEAASPTQPAKRVEGYDLTQIAVPSTGMFTGTWATDLVLAAIPHNDNAVIARTDHFRLDLLGGVNQTVQQDVYPLQIQPASIAANSDGSVLYIVEEGSRTVTVIPVKELDAAARIPFPGLATYRAKMVDAFADLLGGLLQYVKDCICDRLLVSCPSCDSDDIIRLAVVSVRGNAVERVCNFSERKYVKTFPAVEYWLSLVPIVPLIRLAVEKMCCSALPNIFAGYNAPAAAQAAGTGGHTYVSGKQLVGTQKYLTAKNRNLVINTQLNKLRSVVNLGGSVLGSQVASYQFKTPAQTGIQQEHVMNQAVDTASTAIQAKGGTVTTQPFESAKTLGDVVRFAGTPSEIPPGSHVTLYQQNGVVKYYTVETAARAGMTPAAATGASAADVAALRTELENQKTELAKRDQTIAELSKQVAAQQALADRVATLEKNLPKRPGA